MASPRSMWSGSITLGMLNVPVTIGKTWADEREPNLRDVCACHGQPIDRTERCSVTNEPPQGKTKGVQLAEGDWHKFSENEVEAVESATKSDTLEILEQRPQWDYPIEYGTGTYYVRYAPPKKGSTAGLDAFALLVAALGDNAVLVKWCRTATQKLCVLRVNEHGTLLLTQLPMHAEYREPGNLESAHKGVAVDQKVLAMAKKLLASKNGKGDFDWSAYTNEGVALRTAMVDKILDGEKIPEDVPKDEGKRPASDLFALLSESIEDMKDVDVTTDNEKAHQR